MNYSLHVVVLLSYLGISLLHINVKAAPATVEDWSALVSLGLSNCLDEVANGESQAHWPPIKYTTPSEREAPGPSKKAYDLSKRLMDDITSYQKSLPSLTSQDDQAVAQTIGQLQDLRDALIWQQGYINWLLADAVNRVAVVSICSRVLQTRRVDAAIKVQAERLTRFSLSVAAWQSMVEGELGSALPLCTAPEIRETTQGFMELLTFAGGHDSILDVMSHKTAATYEDFIDKKDLSGLILMYIKTDEMLHLSLPLLIQYIEQNPGFSLQDDYRLIKSRMLESIDAKTLGSFLNPYEVSKLGEIPRIMRAYEAQKLDRWVGLGSKTSIEQIAVAETVSDEEIMTMLATIESVKQQLAVLEGLSAGDSITIDEIEKFLGKKIACQPSVGTYHIGRIGEKPSYIRESGQTILLEP